MTEPDVTQFESYRPLMFSIAYRMLGSATEAEDMVQEAYLRYQSVPPEQITSPKALLSTIVTRLCLNYLELAQTQRETYIGPWLPEPVLTAADELAASSAQAELHETISLAFLTLLEELTPLERAVFLLREVFDYEYAEIAQIVAKEEVACRQLFSRAKRHIAEGRPRFKTTPEAHRQMLTRFMQAVSTGDLAGLTAMLAEDATLWADGGGKARGAPLHPLRGRELIAHFLLASTRLAGEAYQTYLAEVNGELAMIVRGAARALVVLSIGVEQGSIHEIRVIGNPDKLKWVSETKGDELA